MHKTIPFPNPLGENNAYIMLEVKLLFKTSDFACFQTKRVRTSMCANVSPIAGFVGSERRVDML